MSVIVNGSNIDIEVGELVNLSIKDRQGPIGPQGIQGPQGEQGEQGMQGEQGNTGSTGASAYQVAVADGFVGTESEWLDSLVGSPIQSLANYTELRSLSSYEHNLVVVKDFTYTGPDGNNYTTLGGIFKKVSSGSENGGTIIVGNYIWERQWDKIHVQPEWWECGGYDKFGNNYTSKNTMSVISNTAFGSIGTHHNGVYNDRDRIQNAIYMGSDTVDVIVQYQAREYIIDKVLSNYHPLLTNYSIGGEHRFNYATIKRINSPVTTLAANLTASATSITVVNASAFRVGQNLSVFSSGSPFVGLGFDESAFLTITGISGNVITVVNGTPSKTFSIGATVMLEVTLFDNRIYTDKSIKYSNGFFNGNKLNGGAQRYPQDWRLNYGISAGTGANSVTFENLEFKDNPAENVSACSGIMTNCRAYNLDGSFFHYSMTDTRYNQGLITGFVIDKCYVDGVCQATDAVANHSEAAITNSLKTEFVKITNCTFKNGAEYIFAFDFGQPDTKCKFIISNNVFENFKYLSLGIMGSPGIAEREDGLIISDNMFYNCGDLVLADLGNTLGMYEGKSINDINITNNIFVGSRFYFRNCTNLNFTNNQVLFRDELNPTFPDYGWNDIDVNPQLAALALIRCSKVKISNNIFENQETENEKLTVAIAVPVQSCTRMKDGSGTNLNFYYEQGISITDNKIYNFHSGINGIYRTNTNITALSNFYGVIGWEFSRNLIVLGINSPTVAGSGTIKYAAIAAQSGTVVDGNTIHQQRDDANQAGIFARAFTPFPLTTSGIIGAIIRNNYIYMRGTNTAITINVFATSSVYNENHVVVNNLYKGTIQGLNAARNYALNNTQINTTNLPYMVNPEIHLFQGFEWNKSQY